MSRQNICIIQKEIAFKQIFLRKEIFCTYKVNRRSLNLIHMEIGLLALIGPIKVQYFWFNVRLNIIKMKPRLIRAKKQGESEETE